MRIKLLVLFVPLFLIACDFDNNPSNTTTNIPQQPENTETYTLPAHQIIAETVQNFGATSVSIAVYTSNGKNVTTAGGTALSNAVIVIRVNYSYNGLGTVVPSQAAVTLAICNLFTGFTNLTASVNSAALFPLPSHSSIILVASDQGANNTRILEYTANNEVIGEFFYGSKQNNTPIKISITYNVSANVTLIEQAVRGLFQHFTNVIIITMLTPPTHEEIISELNKAGATSVNIILYTIAGSNASEGFRAINVAIRLEVDYTTLSTSSIGQAAIRKLFIGFTNTNIYVGNNISIDLPTKIQVLNAAYGSTYDIYTANISTYTINDINASTLSSATSSDVIIIKIHATTWVSTGIGWGLGYEQVINNNSIIANDSRNRINQLFVDSGFNINKISIIFE